MSQFDRIIARQHTGSLKWDRYGERDVIPMWVADMDFQAPAPVITALRQQVEQGVFGYTNPTADLISVIQGYLRSAHDWEVEPSWIVWLPGLVSGLNLVCRSIGDPDDAFITAVPVYPPFLTAPVYSRRQVITVPFEPHEERWVLDPVRIEAAITPRTRLLMLCNPQNPTGRVFSRTELTALLDLCLRRNLIICSDEIHCDLILDSELKHIPMASLSSEAAQQTITLMAPSKTYNIPGLGCSFAIIPNPLLRGQLLKEKRGIIPDVNMLGYTACLAAYRDGQSWLHELRDYLRGNRDLVMSWITAEMPELSLYHGEATYLAWIDVRPCGIDDPVKFFEQFGVGLSDGRYFGWPGFVRLNFACPRSVLQEGLRRMEQAMNSIRR